MRYPPWCASTSGGHIIGLASFNNSLLLRIGSTIFSQTFIEKKSSHP